MQARSGGAGVDGDLDAGLERLAVHGRPPSRTSSVTRTDRHRRCAVRHRGPRREWPPAWKKRAWRRNTDIDVLGSSRHVEHASPHLARSSAASVVTISSTAAVEAFGNPVAPSGAMKAALIHPYAGRWKT